MVEALEEVLVDSAPRAWQEAVSRVRDSPTGEVLNLVVCVEHPTEEIPEELLEQKAEIMARVAQLLGTDVPEDLPFTHGKRIYEWGSDSPLGLPDGQKPLNQLDDYVIPILRDNPQSRRAMMVLGNPFQDQAEDARQGSVPAPQIIQFDREGNLVYVTAYYRAHEIYFFWMVNFIELVRLQETVCEKLGGLSPGPITTISHNAYVNSAALDLDRKGARLAIEKSRLSTMEERDLRALVDRATSGDSLEIDRLDQLISADLNREGSRTLDARPYSIITDHLERRAAGCADMAARLTLKIQNLSSAIARLDPAKRADEFLHIKSIARELIDCVRRRPESTPVILAVAGLNSTGDWLHDLGNAMREDFQEAHFPAKHTRSGFSDLLPWKIGSKLKEFREYYDLNYAAYKEKNPRISVIGHSYGSLIVAMAAARFDIEFEQIILVGSVVPTDFDWRDVAFKRLLNEVGGGDWIARAARYLPSLGDSGRRGFPEQDKVVNVCYTRGEHSDTLGRLHMEMKWVPFLRDGTVIESGGGKKC